MCLVQLTPSHQIPLKTWQNMPSFRTKRLDSKGIEPFFMPKHN